ALISPSVTLKSLALDGHQVCAIGGRNACTTCSAACQWPASWAARSRARSEWLPRSVASRIRRGGWIGHSWVVMNLSMHRRRACRHESSTQARRMVYDHAWCAAYTSDAPRGLRRQHGGANEAARSLSWPWIAANMG